MITQKNCSPDPGISSSWVLTLKTFWNLPTIEKGIYQDKWSASAFFDAMVGWMVNVGRKYRYVWGLCNCSVEPLSEIDNVWIDKHSKIVPVKLQIEILALNLVWKKNRVRVFIVKLKNKGDWGRTCWWKRLSDNNLGRAPFKSIKKFTWVILKSISILKFEEIW